MRSASRSMSREKFSCAWMAAPCPPMMAALARSTLLARLAAMMPSSSEATASSEACCCGAMLRAMWRCVTCESSCAMTLANWSRVVVMAIRPRCAPTKPPGSANAFTLRSRTRKASHAKAVSVSPSICPTWRAAPTSGFQIDCRYSSSTGSSRYAGSRRASRMICSPSRRSLPTLRSSDALSPSDGKRTCARAGVCSDGSSTRAAMTPARRRCQRGNLAGAVRQSGAVVGKRFSAGKRVGKKTTRVAGLEPRPVTTFPLTIMTPPCC